MKRKKYKCPTCGEKFYRLTGEGVCYNCINLPLAPEGEEIWRTPEQAELFLWGKQEKEIKEFLSIYEKSLNILKQDLEEWIKEYNKQLENWKRDLAKAIKKAFGD